MRFDPLVAHHGRLSILAALARDDGQEFSRLRSSSGLTDGNLASHARRLADAGLIRIAKVQREGRTLTHYRLTPVGREALGRHADSLRSAMGEGPAEPRNACLAVSADETQDAAGPDGGPDAACPSARAA